MPKPNQKSKLISVNCDDIPVFSRFKFFVSQTSLHKVSNPWMTYVFYLVLAICSLQALKGIDFRGYLEALTQARIQGLETPPYPVVSAKNGDYFQSPIATILLLPFSYLPLGVGKLVAALYTTLGLLYLLTTLNASHFSKTTAWALLLLFTHALSDAYLSLNPLFLTVILAWASHRLSLSRHRKDIILSGFYFSIALALRPFPALLIPFFVISREKRKVLPGIIFFTSLIFLLTFLILPNPVLWWERWFQALPLYRHAADVLNPTFQTPLSVIARFFVFGLNLPKDGLGSVEGPLAISYVCLCYFFALRFESDKKHDLAFSLLLSCLYCCFARVWACGLFYCFPFLAWAFSKTESRWPLIFALAYSLLPKWAWPSDWWELLMSRFGVQGWFILASLLFAWKLVWNELSLKSKAGS